MPVLYSTELQSGSIVWMTRRGHTYTQVMSTQLVVVQASNINRKLLCYGQHTILSTFAELTRGLLKSSPMIEHTKKSPLYPLTQSFWVKYHNVDVTVNFQYRGLCNRTKLRAFLIWNQWLAVAKILNQANPKPQDFYFLWEGRFSATTYHHKSVAKGEQHYMVYNIWPLWRHECQVAHMCRKVRYFVSVLGAKCIIHVVYVDHEIPACYVAPWDENWRPKNEHDTH